MAEEAASSITQHGGITVDRRDWPLVIVTFPQRDIEDDELDEYLAAVQAGLENRAEPYAAVVNIGARPTLNAIQRKRQAAWMNRNRSRFQKWLKGYAFVITDKIPRLALRAVFWVAPPPVEFRIFGDLAEAVAWARSRLD